jgi:hypothetical protein
LEQLGPVVIGTERALWLVVMKVARTQGKVGNAYKDWVEAVHAKMVAVGVTTLRELVEGILTLNQRLARDRHLTLHGPTMQALLMEAVDMVEWPESGM